MKSTGCVNPRVVGVATNRDPRILPPDTALYPQRPQIRGHEKFDIPATRRDTRLSHPIAAPRRFISTSSTATVHEVPPATVKMSDSTKDAPFTAVQVEAVVSALRPTPRPLPATPLIF